MRSRSATISSRSPGLAASRSVTAARSASERNLAIGERQPPSSSTNAHTRPPAPKRRACSVSASSSERGQLARARVDAADHAAGGERAREDLELRAGQRVAEVADLEAEADVGPVGPVAGHRLVVAQPRPRRRGHREGRGLEHARHQPLDDPDHVVLVHEAHLEVELGELGLAVGAEGLVAEAAGDLVVALEARHHQQLLEQLRRLRERVEGPGRLAGGDEEVARALGRRAGQVRASRARGSRAR